MTESSNVIQIDRYESKANKKIKDSLSNTNDKHNDVKRLEKRVESLETKVTLLTTLLDKQNKAFEDFLTTLRRSQLQDVKAKGKAYDLIKANNITGGLRTFMDESRRSNLQMVSYSSKQIGLEFETSRIRYEKKLKNRNRNKKIINSSKVDD